MKLSALIPIAKEHLWRGKDARRTAARARRLVEHWNPTVSEYTPLAAKVALSRWEGATYNRYRSSLSSLLRAHRLLGGQALELPPAEPEARPRDRVVSPAEQAALEESLGEVVRVLAQTGLRLGELYTAQTTPEGIYLSDTKNGDSRIVPTTLPLPLGPLKDHLNLPPERTFRRRWNEATSALGLDVTPHALRHTAITRWAEAGLSLEAIKALAGHHSLSTTMRYLHLSPAHLLEQISKVPLEGPADGATLRP
jgi:integrase